MVLNESLPRWDMRPIFPSLESREFADAFERVRRDAAALEGEFEARSVRRRETAAVDAAWIADFEEILSRLNALLEHSGTLGAYLNAFVSTDAGNDLAQGLMSEYRVFRITLDQLGTRFAAWVGTSDVDALILGSRIAASHEFVLRKAVLDARHQMAEGEERLAAELQPVSLGGWVRLHGDVSALLTVPLCLRGEERTLPMSAVRALANDADREVRRTAYEAELGAWERVAVPLAAALNGVKGCQQTLRRCRGYPDDLAPTLELENHIDRATLEVMQQACRESFPDFRRYLRAKARALGIERLSWYDVTAPIGEASRTYTWPEAEAFIIEQFGSYSARMAEFAARVFQGRWIDAEPRPGKEGGAFCSGIRPGESRILMNYDGSVNSLSTLAHELGHAYHNLNLADRTPLQRYTPSTCAETASIFCEALVSEAVLRNATHGERLGVLEAALQRDLLVVVDIYSRFLFESAVFKGRSRRELSVRELNELMLDVQRETYADSLDPEHLHPYMWAVKGHYYGPTFYNYPYTFGLLFALGLYVRYQQDPDSFRAGYDALLSSTGLADAASLAGRFGVDVRSIDFWRSSLDIIRRNITEFEQLIS